MNDSVLVYAIKYDWSLSKTLVLKPPSQSRSTTDRCINNLKILHLQGQETLSMVTMDGYLYLYTLNDLTQKPIILNNNCEEFDDNSTWSLSGFGSLVAVGSNSHTVNIWNLETGESKRYYLHSHNVPALAFSPSGRYLASTSIDSSVRILGLPLGTKYCKPCVEWGWGLVWIPRNSIALFDEVPSSNLRNLRGRYRSNNYPTDYLNLFSGSGGRFESYNARTYFNMFWRRIHGVPEGDSDDELQQEMRDETPLLRQRTILDANSDLNQYFLIQTSKSSIHLIDPCIDTGETENNMHVLAVFIPELEILANHFSRLTMVSYFPEISLLIVGNQGGKQVFLMKLCKSPRKEEEIKPEWREHESLYYRYGIHLETTICLEKELVCMVLAKQDKDAARLYCLLDNSMICIVQISPNYSYSLSNLYI